jgi:protein gp37
MSRSNIEWTQDTWNPIVGCSIVSPGCTNCYAMKMAARIEGMNAEALASGRKPTGPHYDGTTHNVNGNNVWTGKLAKASEKTLTEPLRNRKPTVYFVNSMSDLFLAPWDWIDEVFEVMAATPHHTYQILTKRAKEMRQYCSRFGDVVMTSDRGSITRIWPLPNVWLGVSTERQKEANERIPDLLATPAAVRFISAEPLLGPIELWNFDEGVLRGCAVIKDGHVTPSTPDNPPEGVDTSYPGIDWVIVGGESGPGSRPMHPDWARALRDQCLAAGVPFFFKQWGAYLPFGQTSPEPLKKAATLTVGEAFSQQSYIKVGKAKAGRLLDGLLHDEMPEAFRGRRSIADQLEGTAA